MTADTFVDGEWYVLAGRSGRARSHFYRRIRMDTAFARASCGPSYAIDKLLPSDDVDGDKAHKVNPRHRCARCWAAEVAKARRP